MTIKELKQALEGMDENMEVIIEDTNTCNFFSTLDNLFTEKIKGETYAIVSNCPFTGREIKKKKHNGPVTYNTIYTIEEYIAQGFTTEEAPKALRHDILFNKDQDEEATEEEREEMFALVKELGL